MPQCGLASDIKAKYIAGADTLAFYGYVQQQKPAASFVTAYSVQWLYLSIALLMLLGTYLPSLVTSRFWHLFRSA